MTGRQRDIQQRESLFTLTSPAPSTWAFHLIQRLEVEADLFQQRDSLFVETQQAQEQQTSAGTSSTFFLYHSRSEVLEVVLDIPPRKH